MFSNCISLSYLNLFSFKFNSTINNTGAFIKVSSDFVFCIKDNFTKNYLFGNDNISICLESCSDDNNKRISLSYEGCIESCQKYEFEYEYNNVCYHECPNGTFSLLNRKEDNNSKNIRYCYPICDNYYYFDESNIYHCTEVLECPEEYNKLILDKRECIDECKNDDKYKYEYNNTCYQICPYDMFGNETSNFICEYKLVNNENISQKIITTPSDSQIIYECKKDDTLNNNCNFLNFNEEAEILNIIQQNINLLSDTENGKSQVIKGGNGDIYQVTNPKNEKEILKNNFLNNQNISILDLGVCEEKLKHEYIIYSNLMREKLK